MADDHPITISPNPNRVRVNFAGRTVANTTHALSLKEATYPAVQYIPRADVDMSLLTPHRSTPRIVPTKGTPLIIRSMSTAGSPRTRSGPTSSRFQA